MFLLSTSTIFLVVLIYLDDIIVTGSSPSLIDQLISHLYANFALKDLGQLHYFLGIQVSHAANSIHLCQEKYVTDLLKRVDMMDCKVATTPMASKCSLSLFDGEPLPNPTPYKKIVGALQYCTITRPDLNFAVNKVCQYMHSPTTSHWAAVKCILRYL